MNDKDMGLKKEKKSVPGKFQKVVLTEYLILKLHMTETIHLIPFEMVTQ